MTCDDSLSCDDIPVIYVKHNGTISFKNETHSQRLLWNEWGGHERLNRNQALMPYVELNPIRRCDGHSLSGSIDHPHARSFHMPY